MGIPQLILSKAADMGNRWMSLLANVSSGWNSSWEIQITKSLSQMGDLGEYLEPCQPQGLTWHQR